jgi:hypothetical protein
MARRAVVLSVLFLLLSVTQAFAHVAPVPILFVASLPLIAIPCFLGALIKKVLIRSQLASREPVSFTDLIAIALLETVSIAGFLALCVYVIDSTSNYRVQSSSFGKGVGIILSLTAILILNPLVLTFPHIRLLRRKCFESKWDVPENVFAFLLGLISPGVSIIILLVIGLIAELSF